MRLNGVGHAVVIVGTVVDAGLRDDDRAWGAGLLKQRVIENPAGD